MRLIFCVFFFVLRRLSGLGIHVLCLIAIFILPALKLIPMPVLYGVFLFMGLVSLGTNEFYSRILMFFQQPSRYSESSNGFAKRMRPKKIHLYTSIQLFLFVLLYAVKAIKSIAIAFPIVIALCIPIRLYLLPKIFTRDELLLIDGDDREIKECLKGGRRLDFEGDGSNKIPEHKSTSSTTDDDDDVESGEEKKEDDETDNDNNGRRGGGRRTEIQEFFSPPKDESDTTEVIDC